ncbi:MAG: undecaprenyl-diphosphate phosphatase [Isosphaeraceae bacterium]
MEWLEALILGVVQGITEFLPVSSDGHLLVTQKVFEWLTGVKRTGDENLFVIVMLHLGTLAAILIFYRRTIRQGLRGLWSGDDGAAGFRRGEIVRVGVLAAIATSPLVPLALFFKKYLDQAFASDTAAGYGFLITATVLLVTAWLTRREGVKGPAQTTWLDALLIGLAQMFAPLPGVSRSGLTIAAALALGFSRTWAVGFSLLIAIPAILGGGIFELRHVTADLRLLSPVKGVSDVPSAGEGLIIVAAVDNVLHFRMFDSAGKLVVDTDEKQLTEQARQIETLRKQLVGLWAPHELTGSEKGRVIAAVTSIVGHTVNAASLRPDRLGKTFAATIVAGVVGYFAIVWLVRVVKSGRIWWFSIYLIVAAVVVLATFAARGRAANAESEVIRIAVVDRRHGFVAQLCHRSSRAPEWGRQDVAWWRKPQVRAGPYHRPSLVTMVFSEAPGRGRHSSRKVVP